MDEGFALWLVGKRIKLFWPGMKQVPPPSPHMSCSLHHPLPLPPSPCRPLPSDFAHQHFEMDLLSWDATKRRHSCYYLYDDTTTDETLLPLNRSVAEAENATVAPSQPTHSLPSLSPPFVPPIYFLPRRDEPWLFLDESQEELGIKKKKKEGSEPASDLAAMEVVEAPDPPPPLALASSGLRKRESFPGPRTSMDAPGLPQKKTSTVSVGVAAFAVRAMETFFASMPEWPTLEGCPQALRPGEGDPSSPLFLPKAMWMRYCRYLEYSVSAADRFASAYRFSSFPFTSTPRPDTPFFLPFPLPPPAPPPARSVSRSRYRSPPPPHPPRHPAAAAPATLSTSRCPASPVPWRRPWRA